MSQAARSRYHAAGRRFLEPGAAIPFPLRRGEQPLTRRHGAGVHSTRPHLCGENRTPGSGRMQDRASPPGPNQVSWRRLLPSYGQEIGSLPIRATTPRARTPHHSGLFAICCTPARFAGVQVFSHLDGIESKSRAPALTEPDRPQFVSVAIHPLARAAKPTSNGCSVEQQRIAAKQRDNATGDSFDAFGVQTNTRGQRHAGQESEAVQPGAQNALPGLGSRTTADPRRTAPQSGSSSHQLRD